MIGYSMNDTIVVFDRIRKKNVHLSRREPLADLVNRSINQTLSRTVLTSGLTFLTVLSLFLFGGEVLRGFSFALVIGILMGKPPSPLPSPLPCWWLARTGVRGAAGHRFSPRCEESQGMMLPSSPCSSETCILMGAGLPAGAGPAVSRLGTVVCKGTGPLCRRESSKTLAGSIRASTACRCQICGNKSGPLRCL